MSTSPAFQFYAADYLADENVAIMTLEEEGAYIRALSYCWREGSIPADPDILSRLLKGASTTVIQMVQRCFVKMPNDAGRLVHPRLERERQKQRDWAKKSAQGGKLSGKIRREKKLQAEPIVKGGSQKVEPQANSSSSFSSLSPIQKQKHIKPAPAPPAPSLSVPDWIHAGTWDAFEQMRRRIKRPLTDESAKRIIKRLQKWRDQGQDVEEILSKSIENEWQGLWPVEERNGQSGKNQGGIEGHGDSAGIKTGSSYFDRILGTAGSGG